MAVLAVVTAGNVRRILAGRGETIMARTTRTEDLRVVDGVGRRPDVAVVAVFANIACLYMRLCLAGGLDPIVAAEAVPDDAGMVEIRRSPCICCMAIITGIAAVNMRRVFASGRDAVVARAAGANHLGVVDG